MTKPTKEEAEMLAIVSIIVFGVFLCIASAVFFTFKALGIE
ncbi:MAG: hypothetical protein JWR59_2523 [Brevundimonas sp.]|nr:hypothetical protein [Brevundimonas sp.]